MLRKGGILSTHFRYRRDLGLSRRRYRWKEETHSKLAAQVGIPSRRALWTKITAVIYTVSVTLAPLTHAYTHSAIML